MSGIIDGMMKTTTYYRVEELGNDGWDTVNEFDTKKKALNYIKSNVGIFRIETFYFTEQPNRK